MIPTRHSWVKENTEFDDGQTRVFSYRCKRCGMQVSSSQDLETSFLATPTTCDSYLLKSVMER